MKISEVEIVLIKPRNGLIGFASLVVGGALYLGGIGVHAKRDGSGYRLTYPTKQGGKDALRLHHPITRAAGKALEAAIFTKLNAVMAHARHDRPDYP
ncbi:MAG: septation protein SpoVG family protein [Alphaproteobacteria bacterium]|jgi:hypothetical protein|nr:septation protein SpoVG family protein [Alphaproteobacteria bacterium]